MKREIILELICSLLVLMWGYAAFSKLFIYEGFRFQLLGHKLLADHAWTIAWLIPAIEIIIAVLLLFTATRRAGLWASVSLLLIFTVYIIYMFNFYPAKPCSCGGIIGKLGWKEHIVFNLFFMGLSLAALLKVKRHGNDRQPVFIDLA